MRIPCGKKLAVAGLLSVLGAGVAMPSLAQGNQPPASGKAAGVQAPSQEMRASKLIGKKVINAQGDNLGDIDDLMINADNQRVYYAVLTAGGFLGIGDKQLAVPVSRFRTGRDDQLVLDVDKQRLQQAPSFERKQRPAFDDNYRRGVDRFYFTAGTHWQAPQGARLLSARDLVGANVNDRAAHHAGEIEDVVVNFGTGRAYAVFDFDRKWSPDDKLLPMPLNAFSFPSRPDLDILLSIDREKIDMARGFEDDKWPDLNNAEYQQKLNQHLLALESQSKSSPQATQTGREAATTGASE